MGFNTVAFLLNDRMNELEKSSKTVAWYLSHPPMSLEDKARQETYRFDLSKQFNEPVLDFQALEVLPTFHADEQKFFLAGGNCIVDLKALELGVSKEGKKTITLELPEWFEPRWFLVRGQRIGRSGSLR